MSAPNTNIEKQKRRHIGPLVGIAVALMFAGALLFWFLGSELVDTDSVDGPAPATEHSETPTPADSPDLQPSGN